MKRVIHPRDIGLGLPRFLRAKHRAQKPKTSEAVIQAQVEAYLDVLHLYHLHLHPYLLRSAFGYKPTVSGAELQQRREAAEAIRGFPDLLVLAKDGRFLALELKTTAGKLTQAQKIWQASIGTAIARSFEEAREIIDLWRADG